MFSLQVFVKFMKSHRCHDLIPDGYNNKLIIFDTQLKVQKGVLVAEYIQYM